MPWTAWIVVLSLIFSVCSAAADVETKYSRFGEIMLTRDFQNGSTIKLDGKVLYQSGKMQHLNIVEIIATKNRDYIVISENLGGSGTPDAYSVISIGPGNFEKLFANLELKFYEGRVSHKPLGAGIRLSLEDEGVYNRYAVIENDAIRFEKVQMAHPKSLDPSECQALFTQVLSECATQKREGPGCRDVLSDVSMSSQRTVFAIAKNVFFPEKAFAAVCDAVCSRGYVWLQYDQFAKNICYFR